MGRATRWLKGLFKMKRDKDLKDKNGLSFGRDGSGGLCNNPATIPPNLSAAKAAWVRSFYVETEQEQICVQFNHLLLFPKVPTRLESSALGLVIGRSQEIAHHVVPGVSSPRGRARIPVRNPRIGDEPEVPTGRMKPRQWQLCLGVPGNLVILLFDDPVVLDRSGLGFITGRAIWVAWSSENWANWKLRGSNSSTHRYARDCSLELPLIDEEDEPEL